MGKAKLGKPESLGRCTCSSPVTMLCWVHCRVAEVCALLSADSYCGRRVCLSVCLFVCPLAYLKSRMSKCHPIFCTCYLWSWLVPLWRQYVMYFQFCGWRHVFTECSEKATWS